MAKQAGRAGGRTGGQADGRATGRGGGKAPAEARGRVRSLAQALQPVMRPLLKDRPLAEAQLLLDWPEVVGPHFAGLCRPLKVRFQRRGETRDGVLELACSGPAALELQHAAPQLLQRVNAFLGYPAVARLALKQVLSEPPPGTQPGALPTGASPTGALPTGAPRAGAPAKAARPPPARDAVADGGDRLERALDELRAALEAKARRAGGPPPRK